MKSTDTFPSVHVPKKSQPEEFDLVILGGGAGSTIAASASSRKHTTLHPTDDAKISVQLRSNSRAR